MKRTLIVLACLCLSLPLLAEKQRRVPAAPQSPLAPATNTIMGSPLTIVVGDDTSMQVYNSNVPGTGQFYPPDCNPGETADSGVFAAVSGVIYGPDFDNHPCGSASNTYTPWTPISMTAVTGTGTGADPYTVVIVAIAGLTGMQLEETLTYVNGSGTVNTHLSFTLLAPTEPGAPQGGLPLSLFLGADLYLADNDSGFSFASAVASGGHGASSSCTQLQYTISLLGTTPANGWTATGYGDVWDQISAGTLSNAFDPTCIDNGAALQWNFQGGGGVDTGVSFTGQAVPVASAVPSLSAVGIAALVVLLALVGYVLARKTSLGA
jgi:hypothetical protein